LARVTNHQGSNPGPGAYDVSGSIGKGPKFSFKGRYETTARPVSASYHTIPSTVGTGPKFSLSGRHDISHSQDTPGPGYIPPPLGQDGKKITMSYRHNETKDSRVDNPGPGSYSIEPKFAKDANKFTLRGRNDMKSTESASPGPGAYLPDYNFVKKRAPSPTFHIRPKESSLQVTPGPADYPVPRELGGPKSSFHIRPQTTNSTNVTPGPGSYEPTDKNLKTAPKFTMKSRRDREIKTTSAEYHYIPSTIGEGPKISFGSRHVIREVEDTPGPSYVPPSLGNDSKKVTMGIRHNEVKDSRSDNPGPGAYKIEPLFAKDACKFTLHGRTGDKSTESVSPGPGAYMPNFDAVKSRAPSSSMHIRPKEKTTETTPGYVNLGSTLTEKKVTIGSREKVAVIPI